MLESSIILSIARQVCGIVFTYSNQKGVFMGDISNPEIYFTQTVPKQYAAALSSAPANVADQPELSAVYEITGAGGGTYALRVAGGQLEALSSDQLTSPDMRVVMSYDDWR